MRALWLLIGFALMISFPLPVGRITVFPLGGFLLILFAVLRMEKLEPAFKKARYALYAAIPIAAAVLGLQLYATLAADAVFSGFTLVNDALRMLCELAEGAVMVFIYIGVKIIGQNADIPALEKQSGRNMTVMVIYLISQLGISLIWIFCPSIFTGFEIVLLYPPIFGVIWRAMNVWTAYTLMTKVSVSKA